MAFGIETSIGYAFFGPFFNNFLLCPKKKGIGETQLPNKKKIENSAKLTLIGQIISHENIAKRSCVRQVGCFVCQKRTKMTSR